MTQNPPYKLKQEISIDFKTYRNIVSIDRRKQVEQINNKYLVLVMIQEDYAATKFAKLRFEGGKCLDEIIFSEINTDRLFSCHTMEDDIIVAFYG